MDNKVIVILGPTASGKTDLSVRLAKKFRGEIVSADSRQVYKGLDIGSGKITKQEMRGIPHHLLDIANPKKRFSVARYQKLARAALKKIQKKNRVPFLVGGTGFYIQSIVDGIYIPEVPPNQKLRAELQKKSVTQLFLMLKKLDPERAKNIDAKNPVRLIRAIEIIKQTKKPVPPLFSNSQEHQNDFLQIGITKSKTELKKLIARRLKKRMAGIITEVKKLHFAGLTWRRLEELGLEYRYTAQYIQGKITYQKMADSIQKESEQYAKRQMTWFKRNRRIHWVSNFREAEKLIKNFLK